MAVNTSLVTMVRVLVNDFNSTEWTDDQIKDAVGVAAQVVVGEYDFSTNYIIDLSIPDISPDPVTALDNAATALFGLKAACILNTNRYQKAVTNGNVGVKIRDGDSQIDMSSGFNGYRDILERGPCKSYDKLLTTLQYSRSMSLGKGIGTPLTHPDHTGPSSYSNVSAFFDGFRYLR